MEAESFTDIDSLTALYPDLDEQTLKELHCNVSNYIHDVSNASYLHCGFTWDGVSCWPATLAGTTAKLSCFSELNGVKYDVTTNASKRCFENGTWDRWSNYRSCVPLNIPQDEYFKVLWDLRDAATVYYIGYGISLVALTLALWIFLSFKDLRCLRNTIHANLMCTYILLDITWIVTAKLQLSNDHIARSLSCYLTIMLTYLMGTNFFWMFVEGLYLFILVVKTFQVDNIKIYVYATIGWGLPAVIAIPWASVKGYFTVADDNHPDVLRCPWQHKDHYDFILSAPIILVLLINIIFLMKIMWVLITKLRATNTVESEQYRKAAKALLVLIPLLGVTYLLLIVTPEHGTGEVIFTFIQAIFLSIQGFIVAVLYCFLNGEVQNSVKHRLERWKIRQAINRGQHQSLSCRSSPRAEKFYRSRGGVRDSCISFTTSTSFVNFPPTIRSPSVPAVNKLDCNATLDERTPMKDDTV